MSNQLEATEAAAILQAITDANPEGVMDVQPFAPPLPPTLMTLTVRESGETVSTWHDVAGSSLVSPSCFRFELLDRRIVLMDMAGRDFILTPQVD